jgi:transcriptional regulator with XRE-family HTH domain
MAKKQSDPLEYRLRDLFEQSGMTLDELGQKMGHSGEVARKSAWQFLNKAHDHRVSMLRKFADAVGVPVVDLFSDDSQ